MKLILVRHGATDWNQAQRFQGQANLSLNETGRQQAEALAKKLAAQPLDGIIHSDLVRARQTAEAIARQRDCWLQEEPRLREISFGEWEGMTYAEIQSRAPEALAAWEQDPLEAAPPGGETIHQLAGRVELALKDMRQKYSSQTILVVAHGGPLQVLICQALGLSPAQYWQFHLSNASVSHLAFYPAGAILNGLNDTAHLEAR